MESHLTSEERAEAKRRLDVILARPPRRRESSGESSPDESSSDESSSDLEAEADVFETDCDSESDEGDEGLRSDEDEGDEDELPVGDEDGGLGEDEGRRDETEEPEDPGREAHVSVFPDAYKSRNGQIAWSAAARGERAAASDFPESPGGPTPEAIAGAGDIATSFLLFFTPAIERLVLLATNLEISRRGDPHGRPMDEIDLRAYVGLLLLAGVYRSRNEAASSLWHAQRGRPIFRATMSLRRFTYHSVTLRFDDRATRAARSESDKIAPISKVWNAWCDRLPELYDPGPEITVDERMVPFKGRCSFKQYMPNKPSRYGLKLWVVCDARTSYAWKIQLYTGKGKSGVREKNQASRVVLDLTGGLERRHLTCDNFFTSYELATKLLEKDVTLLGTIRTNKPELPQELVSARGRAVFSTRFAFTDLAALISYVPKKNRTVLLLSTRHRGPEISEGRADKKPAAILDYNRTKGGVDNLDKLLATYSCRRMTKRWPMALFHNVVDVSAYNAFVVWRETHPDWMRGKRNRRRMFIEQLGTELVTPLIKRRTHAPRARHAHEFMAGVRGAGVRGAGVRGAGGYGGFEGSFDCKRKRCQVCPRARDAKTSTVCKGCGRYICGGCTVQLCPGCACLVGCGNVHGDVRAAASCDGADAADAPDAAEERRKSR